MPFASAFNQPDPATHLLELRTIVDLVFLYMDLIAESPTQIYKYAETLSSRVRELTITVAGGDRLANPAQLNIRHAFIDVFVDFHNTMSD